MNELVAAVHAAEYERVFVARALAPTIQASLDAAFHAIELPFVRGRTVVPDDLTDRDLVVAGHPNHLGVFDLPDVSWLAVTGMWSALREPGGAVATVATDPPVDRVDAKAALDAARALAKRAGQLAGVTVAFAVESPVLVVLLEVDPVPVAAEVPGSTALDAFAELPGGLRIEVKSSEIDGYASAMERAISSHR